ncbi:MAG: hypothetical protein H7Y43_11975 [Akkermansiaceae bacterium]|nr:hypothetical protein [Verrucomicrobiales bacterium]
MNLDDAQRKKVAAWIEEGLKLSDIQSRIASELGVRLTYMDVRFLVDDLKLTPKDIDPPKPPASALSATPAVPSPAGKAPLPPSPAAIPPATGSVSLTIDQLARPGSMVSGKVTFTDGNIADWYIDQTGRLGLAPQVTGYRPAPADVQQFQIALEAELAKLGI